MPIYEYRCSTCGYQNEYLQKVSDPKLTDCPDCGKSTFTKLVTAAGFHLKGSGWYVTDFKGNGTKPEKTADKADKTEVSEPAKKEDKKEKTEPASGSAASPSST